IFRDAHTAGGRFRRTVGSSNPTLLIVEDMRDQAVLIGLAARRKRKDLQVRAAEDGFDAAAYLTGIEPYQDRQANPVPDVIILDLFMPRVDGFAFLNWLRKQEALSEIPVAVLTSSGRSADESRARWLGAKVVYRKPDDLLELGEVVGEIIETYLPRNPRRRRETELSASASLRR
ncbi:MAG: response regulator, partial [Longimicrobiales bacterium]|nr:response regulator [Longimicrobiales bacterium]